MKQQPRYLDIRQAIIDRVRSGELPVGSRLPSRDALMRDFGVTRVTVDRAMRSLLESGLLVSRRRGGTMVAGAAPPARVALVSRFMPQATGISPETANFYALFHGLFDYASNIQWEVIQPDALTRGSKVHEKYDVVVVVRPRPGVIESLKVPHGKLIVINRYIDDCRCSSTSHREATRRMTLAMLEHSRDGEFFFYDPDNQNEFLINERRQGFIDACAAKKSFYRVLTGEMLPATTGIPVICCPYAGLTKELIAKYTASGKVFGRDYICYDFDNFSTSPPVPTAIQDYAAIGRAVVEMILHPGSPAEHRLFAPEFRNFDCYGISFAP
ncbi:MAG: GntR family transcriptional regulator [Victivallaceae bacterium]